MIVLDGNQVNLEMGSVCLLSPSVETTAESKLTRKSFRVPSYRILYNLNRTLVSNPAVPDNHARFDALYTRYNKDMKSIFELVANELLPRKHSPP